MPESRGFIGFLAFHRKFYVLKIRQRKTPENTLFSLVVGLP
jgi:hypothetical protein